MNYKRKNLELVRNKCKRNFTWTGFTNQRLGVFGNVGKEHEKLIFDGYSCYLFLTKHKT